MSIQGCEKVGFPLWRKAVDKSVENVENSQLSTGIPPVYRESSGGWENGRIVSGAGRNNTGHRKKGGSKTLYSLVKKLVLMGKELTKGSLEFFGLPKICG